MFFVTGCTDTSLGSEFGTQYESEHVGYAAARSEQYLRYVRLRDTATLGELVQLTEHHNPAVRVYAVLALLERDADVLPVLRGRLGDEDEFSTMEGRVISDQRPADLMIRFAWPVLSDAGKQMIGHALIRKDTRLESLRTVLASYKPAKDDRPPLLRLLENRSEALRPLALLGRVEDRGLIVRALRDADRTPVG